MALGYPVLYVANSSWANTSNISGTLYYELATPQVISIPKKHLKAVDLGSLSWFVSGGTAGHFAVAKPSDMKTISSSSLVANLFSSKYITVAGNYKWGSNMQISLETNDNLYLCNTNCANVNELLNELSGVYLFYETQNEVDDFVNEEVFQRGGSIMTYENSTNQIETECLANVELKIQVK